jgi:hypothetical protein
MGKHHNLPEGTCIAGGKRALEAKADRGHISRGDVMFTKPPQHSLWCSMGVILNQGLCCMLCLLRLTHQKGSSMGPRGPCCPLLILSVCQYTLPRFSVQTACEALGCASTLADVGMGDSRCQPAVPLITILRLLEHVVLHTRTQRIASMRLQARKSRPRRGNCLGWSVAIEHFKSFIGTFLYAASSTDQT